MNSQTVIFIHIPKAAGTTFYQVLDCQYKAQHMLHIKGGQDRKGSIDAFRKLSEEKRARLRCIRGHVPFGLHQWLSQPATYITILRNPIQRVVSYYYFVRNTPRHHFHREVIERNLSLEDFVRKMVDINENNLQTRWISGWVDFDASLMPPYEDLPAHALELAKENIKNHFVVCGLTERFDESLLLMQKVLRWKNVYYMRRNVGKRRPSKGQLPVQTLRMIEKYEEKDLELCEHVAKKLQTMLNTHRIGDEQIRQFGSMNRRCGFLIWAQALNRRLVIKTWRMLHILQ